MEIGTTGIRILEQKYPLNRNFLKYTLQQFAQINTGPICSIYTEFPTKIIVSHFETAYTYFCITPLIPYDSNLILDLNKQKPFLVLSSVQKNQLEN